MQSRSTIEIRIFNSARTWTELLSYIQLLDSVYHYTKDIAPDDMEWRDYYRFIAKKDQYFILADNLEKNPKPQNLQVPAPSKGRQIKGKSSQGWVLDELAINAGAVPGAPQFNRRRGVPDMPDPIRRWLNNEDR